MCFGIAYYLHVIAKLNNLKSFMLPSHLGKLIKRIIT